MARIIIQREKAWNAMAIKVTCCINGEQICCLKNGESHIVEVNEDVIEFSCFFDSNLYSEVEPNKVLVKTDSDVTIILRAEANEFTPVIYADKFVLMTESVGVTDEDSGIPFSDGNKTFQLSNVKKDNMSKEKRDELIGDAVEKGNKIAGMAKVVILKILFKKFF